MCYQTNYPLTIGPHQKKKEKKKKDN